MKHSIRLIVSACALSLAAAALASAATAQSRIKTGMLNATFREASV